MSKTSCINCPDHSTCVKPCDKIENYISKDDVSLRERRESDFKSGKNGKSYEKKNDKDEKGDLSLDDFRRLIPKKYKNEWDKVSDSPVPRGIVFDGYKTKILRKYIDSAVTSEERESKKRSRFWAFLRCKNMAQIATGAGCSNANIGKQFTKIISKMLKKMNKDYPLLNIEPRMTPKKFKDFIVLENF